MNLICPNCGQSGDGKMFPKIGNKKLLCNNCKAILQLALKCPACDGIVAIPFISMIQISRIKKILRMSILSNSNDGKIRCPVCDYEAGAEQFDRVVVFKEEYSVIVS